MLVTCYMYNLGECRMMLYEAGSFTDRMNKAIMLVRVHICASKEPPHSIVIDSQGVILLSWSDEEHDWSVIMHSNNSLYYHIDYYRITRITGPMKGKYDPHWVNHIVTQT